MTNHRSPKGIKNFFSNVRMELFFIYLLVLAPGLILQSFTLRRNSLNQSDSASVTKFQDNFKLISFEMKVCEGEYYFQLLIIEHTKDCLYLLERSQDNKHFELLLSKQGSVSPMNQPLLHCFVDESPLSGVSYYRLRRFDKNGCWVSDVLTGKNFSTHSAALQNRGTD